MNVVQIPVSEIKSWKSFHQVFAKIMGFPDFYGCNMNAWIDCMTDIDEPDNGMTKIHVRKGEVMVLDLGDCREFAQRCPEQYQELLECTAFVNHRRMELGQAAVLCLSFDK